MNRHRKAFSMIEVLLVVGVLVILAAIVLVGMRSITGRSKEQQTKLILQNLRGMLAELENSTRLGKGPPEWGWWRSSGWTMINSASGKGEEFWVNPSQNYTNPAAQPLDAPGFIGTATGNVNDPANLVRNGSRQILATQIAMNFLLSVPANRSAMQGMQSDKFFTPAWVGANLPGPGADRVLRTADDAGSSETVHYFVGNRVEYGGRVYRCRQNHASAPNSPPPPSNPASWVEEGSVQDVLRSLPTVLVCDAWNNPILLVPPQGMYVRILNGEPSLNPTQRGQTLVVVSPEGSVKPGNLAANTAAELVRPGRAFFASAGPDGDFTTGDDNLYSFEE